MPVPEGFQEIELEMSNFDLSIDDGFAEALIGKSTYGRHAAWNFNGLVWHADGMFHEEVWQYHCPIDKMSASSLSELMSEVNSKWGSR